MHYSERSMPRTPSIWLRSQDGWWYVTIQGHKQKLSKDKKEAQKAFHTLMSVEPEPEEQGGFRPNFRKLADLFLEEAKRTKGDMTYTVQKHYLQSFCNHIGKRKAAEIKVHHASEWIHSHDNWSESTRTTARGIVLACLNWSVQQDYLTANPLAKFKRGEYTRRERFLTPEERTKVLGWLQGNIRDFMYVVDQTGARPYSEIGRITAEMIDFETGTILFKKHKNAKKGKKRVIYLTEGLRELFKRMCEEKPTGLLFHTRNGIAWNQGTAMKWIRKAETVLAIPRFTVYSFRHAYISECLAKGMSAEIVAELVGNSPATIHKYYSHIDQKTDTLRSAAQRAVS